MHCWNCTARSPSSAAGDGIGLAVLDVAARGAVLSALATRGPEEFWHPAASAAAIAYARAAIIVCRFMASTVGGRA
jgi:hypothetical protein